MDAFYKQRLVIAAALLVYAVSAGLLVWAADRFFPSPHTRTLALVMAVLLPVFMYFVCESVAGGSTGRAAVSTNTFFQIGAARLMEASRELSFGDLPEDIQPKVFDLLVYMIRNRHRVVSKEELLETIWPDVVVTDASLTQTIKRVRDAFRRNGFEADIIRTIPRKGYQFDHEVVEVIPDRAPQQSIHLHKHYPTLIATLLSAFSFTLIWLIEPSDASGPASERPMESVLVLPFSDLSNSPDFAYFTRGLTETITYKLTQAENLRVIASSSAKQLDTDGTSAEALGKQLGVSHVVTGTVQKQQSALRIRAAVIATQTGEQIWTQQFDRTLSNVFAVHDEIASALLRRSQSLIPGSAGHASTEGSQAYLLVLQADALVQQGKLSALTEARRVYRQALTLAPMYADAMVGLADAIRRLTTLGEMPRETGFSEAVRLATKASELDPTNAEAFVQLAEIQHRHFWNFPLADASYQQAIRTRPSYAPAHVAYGRFLSKSGQYQLALERARSALGLDPLSASAAGSLTIRLIRANALTQARVTLDQMQRNHAQNPNLPWLETNWHIASGQYQQALQWISREELPYLQLSLSAIALHHLGRTGQAQKSLDELIRTDADGAAFQIAEVYAQFGMPDDAFEWLQRAFEQGDPGIIELYSSVNLANLYQDPRFFSLARQVGLPPVTAQDLLSN